MQKIIKVLSDKSLKTLNFCYKKIKLKTKLAQNFILFFWSCYRILVLKTTKIKYRVVFRVLLFFIIRIKARKKAFSFNKIL